MYERTARVHGQEDYRILGNVITSDQDAMHALVAPDTPTKAFKADRKENFNHINEY